LAILIARFLNTIEPRKRISELTVDSRKTRSPPPELTIRIVKPGSSTPTGGLSEPTRGKSPVYSISIIININLGSFEYLLVRNLANNR
jgi:hypothetical protein